MDTSSKSTEKRPHHHRDVSDPKQCSSHESTSSSTGNSRKAVDERHGKQNVSPASQSTRGERPPTYTRHPHAITHHGDTRVDPYYWLREGRVKKLPSAPSTHDDTSVAQDTSSSTKKNGKTASNPVQQKVKRLLSDENAYMEHLYSRYAPNLRKTVYQDLKSRMKEDDVSLPSRDRNYWYYSRSVKNAAHPLYCRRPYRKGGNCDDALDKPDTSKFMEEVADYVAAHPHDVLPQFPEEEIYLDVNALALQLGLEYVEIGSMDVSFDEQYLAMTVDCSGGEEIFTTFIVKMKDINYSKWLSGQSRMHQTWSQSMADQGLSMYTPPSMESVAAQISAGKKREGKANAFSPTGKRKGFPTTPVTTSQVSSDSMNSTADSSQRDGREGEEKGHKKKKSTPNRIHAALDPANAAAGDVGAGVAPLSSDSGASSLQPDSTHSTPTPPRKPIAYPKHEIVQRIDVFDGSGEVVWVNEHSLMYVGVDEKMRPCRVIYHDTRCSENADVADVVCYEEDDEAFWVEGAHFTSDKQFVLVGSGGKNCTEMHVVPTSAHISNRVVEGNAMEGEKRQPRLDGPPVFTTLPAATVAGGEVQLNATTEEEEEDSSAQTTHCHDVTPNGMCFQTRMEDVEYEIDHHSELLWPALDDKTHSGGGAWVVITNSHGRDNFAIDYLTDASWDATVALINNSTPNARTDVSTISSWKPLFAYNPQVKVEGVDCTKDMLLISVRYNAFPSVLLCPTRLIHVRYAEAMAAGIDFSPLDLLRDTVNANWLVPRSVLTSASTQPLNSSCVAPASETQRPTSGPIPLAPLVGVRSDTQASNSGIGSAHEGGGRNSVHDVIGKVDSMDDEGWHRTVSELNCINAYAASDNFNTRTWHIVVSNMICPWRVYTVSYTAPEGVQLPTPTDVKVAGADSLGSVEVTFLKEETLSGPPYDPKEYYACLAWVPMEENSRADASPSSEPHVGNLIPVYICGKRSELHRGMNPLLLYVYGSYGDSSDPEFSSDRLALLDRGFVYAVAGVRGSGDLGRPWRDAGRLLHRGNCVKDLLSVARVLRSSGWCAPNKLMVTGSSAGGFVATAAVNAEPHLFRALLAAVPFVDCLTTLLDASLPLSVSDWEEYGNPIESKESYFAIRAYSPMDNIPSYPYANSSSSALSGETPLEKSQVVFPHMFFQTSWGDSRVGYWESLSLVAHLREVWSQGSEQQGRFLAHYCDFDSGHGGASGRYEQLREIAREYAFAILVSQA